MHAYQQQEGPLSHQLDGFEYNETGGSAELPGYHYAPPQFIPSQPQGQRPADATLIAALSYSLCWFSGIVACLFGWQNRYVRFHALQALVFFGLINVIDVALLRFIFFGTHRMYGHTALLAIPAILAFLLVNCIAFIGWVMGMIQAARGRYYRLPFIGGLVARITNVGEMVK